MFVSGPVGTSVTGRGCAESVLAIQSIACSGSRLAGGWRQVGAVEAALAVDIRGDVTLSHERTLRAGGHGYVVAAKMVEHADRVRGRLLDRLVARRPWSRRAARPRGWQARA